MEKRCVLKALSGHTHIFLLRFMLSFTAHYYIYVVEFDLRLADGATDTEGRLEVSVDGVWGTVCDDFFESNDAAVACSQLG